MPAQIFMGYRKQFGTTQFSLSRGCSGRVINSVCNCFEVDRILHLYNGITNAESGE